MRVTSLFLTMALCTVAAAPAALGDDQPHASRLHGDLTAGPHPVGFTRLVLRDDTRPEGPAHRDGRVVPLDRRARPITVDVWYPAVRSADAPMSVSDYLVAHRSPVAPTDLQEQRAERAAMLRRTLSGYGTLDDASFDALLADTFLAVRDAAPAPGPFPLIVGQLRPFATTITNEHLASHGYVLAYVSGGDGHELDPGRGLEVAVRDMEVAVARLRRTRPQVDPAALGALGFSGAGFSQILLAMRHPDVMAVCDLESAIFDDRVMWPLQRGWGYDVAALRVPFLHMYGVPLSEHENRRADFEQMRYSTRYHYLADAPGLTHADFATEGMLASLTPGLRGAQGTRTRQVFETTNRYLRAFFDAHVKKDAAARAFLESRPEANGTVERLVTMRVLPAIVPAMTAEEFGARLQRHGGEVALGQFRADRARDPQAPVFEERSLNAVGYRLFHARAFEPAVAVLREVVEMYPASPNAYDSLSEVLEGAGRTDEARAVAQRGVVVAAAPSVTPGDREAFTRMLRQRLARLDRSASR